ncbi:uncharacterized protein MELLADRAFT_66239 [Melampsora larici-populina 98AG31]|uniref:Uncharacterized protein n=1 Tax=Melampsora larici-populina (strain 98AG31 / pathotype 3-4-7) TaxID=747676 RepID=F4RYE0_MELLP|nr:uncharacterized protein MELLADRAFT_66239 [Melampsora larici-populina 98AG31]EGG02452.1 hypothetical protein MELLADRAFT_66239 [Melampsora larici-populina 98AG31]
MAPSGSKSHKEKSLPSSSLDPPHSLSSSLLQVPSSASTSKNRRSLRPQSPVRLPPGYVATPSDGRRTPTRPDTSSLKRGRVDDEGSQDEDENEDEDEEYRKEDEDDENINDEQEDSSTSSVIHISGSPSKNLTRKRSKPSGSSVPKSKNPRKRAPVRKHSKISRVPDKVDVD